MTTEIQFNSQKKPGDGWCMQVTDPPDDLLNPDDLITSLESIEIEFDYPLGQPVRYPYKCPGGFTRLELFESIRYGYVRIYEAPGANGIWGHAIEVLVLEGARLDGNLVKLMIGS